jgi:hypothetical protein
MIKTLLKYLQCCILGILVVTPSLNKIRIENKHWFLLFGVPQCEASPITPYHDLSCVDGLVVFIPAYAAASALVACCIAVSQRFPQ